MFQAEREGVLFYVLSSCSCAQFVPGGGANLHTGCKFGHVNGVLRICTRVQIVHMNANRIFLYILIGDFDKWQAFSITMLFKFD